MSSLPGFQKSQEPVTQETLAKVMSPPLFYEKSMRIVHYYDPSISATYMDIGYFIIFFGRKYYPVVDVTKPISNTGSFMYYIRGFSTPDIELDENEKEVYIDKLIICKYNLYNDQNNQTISFDCREDIHIKTIELLSNPLFLENGGSNLKPSEKVIIPTSNISSVHNALRYNPEKDIVELLWTGGLEDRVPVPIEVKNNHLGGKVHFVKYSTIQPAGFIPIDNEIYNADNLYILEDKPILILSSLYNFYIDDDFVALDIDSSKINISSVYIDQLCFNISLPSFITSIEMPPDGGSVYINGYWDISRCIDFQLESLITTPLSMTSYGTIRVNATQFASMQSQELIVQRTGEDFWVLKSTKDETERINYVKVVQV